MYACGLRISEAAKLPITAIDSKRMLLRVIASETSSVSFR